MQTKPLHPCRLRSSIGTTKRPPGFMPRARIAWRLPVLLLLLGVLTNRLQGAEPQSPSFGGVTPAGAAQWRDLKFGLMLHWGLYSVPGGVWNGTNVPGYNEQIKHRAKIPSAEYNQLTNQFRAEKFDPDFIARIAKEAGMRHVIITSKHHDGFNLWHTKLSDFNAVDATPFNQDAIKLLSDACARHGMKFGVYYSLIDWHYPGATPMSDHNSDAITPALEEYTMGQLRELLTGYGPLSEIWFDMSKPSAVTTKSPKPGLPVPGKQRSRSTMKPGDTVHGRSATICLPKSAKRFEMWPLSRPGAAIIC